MYYLLFIFDLIILWFADCSLSGYLLFDDVLFIEVLCKQSDHGRASVVL